MRLHHFVLSMTLAVAASGGTAAADISASGPVAEGCINQNVSIGPWRLRVTKVVAIRRKSPVPDIPPTGWGIMLEWTNASAKRHSETGAANWELGFPSGKVLGLFAFDSSKDLSKKGTGVLGPGEDQTGVMDAFSGPFAPGATRRAEIKFWYPAANEDYSGHPTKLIISGESYLTTHFGTARFRLTCTK